MQSIITVKLDPTKRFWTTTHNDPDIFELFGTYEVPTAFRACKAKSEVVADIKNNFPNCEVR